MSYTFLFDLDVLLDTNNESFALACFRAFSRHMASSVSSSIVLPALYSATRLMMDSEDPSLTLQEVFEKEFYGKVAVGREDLKDAIEGFYDHFFRNLSVTTNPHPEAGSLIKWARSRGHRIAITANPLLPSKITYHRLQCAGFDLEQFELVPSCETFHFSKKHPAFYGEMLGHLGWPEGPVVMIGNGLERDLTSAKKLGLQTYIIDDESASYTGTEAGRGTWAELRTWLEALDPSKLEPSFKSPEAITAILTSTPAVLHSMTKVLTGEQWRCEPTPEDWAINEIICHLRDTDSEIHRVQLNLMIEKIGAFIPRPNASIWANERKYLNIDGHTALKEFTVARKHNLETLRRLELSIWSRKARHAIFGPTSFVEVVGFIADHDRAHIQQVWKTLNAIRSERV